MEERAAAQHSSHVPFQAHVELLQLFLAHRDEIVERIQGLLNAQRKPIEYLKDERLLSRHFEDCFFSLVGITSDHARLPSQLQEAHWASGFRPRRTSEVHNDLVDPAEMMVRAFYLWRQTHWPGYSGRVRYAHTLFNLYVIRSLALMSLHIWDEGSSGTGNRLSQIQGLLDRLWSTAQADQPVLVRDVRWLIPVAQSPTTDELAGYFTVSRQISETLSEQDSIEICKAGVRMAGGHLRSQLRHVSTQKNVSLDENSLLLTTRRSNALDLALLVQSLVPLLAAYEQAINTNDDRNRHGLADAICQGISPDPELFVNRLDLLGPYSMIEHLFITTDRDGHAGYTPMGQRHLTLLQEYATRISRLSKPLYDDSQHFKPIDGTYSPYGVLFGHSSNLIEHIAFKAAQREAVTRFSLEDAFAAGDADKLAGVNGWRKLPHVTQEMAKRFEYPQRFAEEIFARIENAMRRRVSDGEAAAAVPAGHLFIVEGNDLQADERLSPYILSSDMQIVADGKADSYTQTDLLHSRTEGEFVVSYKTSGGWVAVSKDILTEVLGSGQDAKIVGLPREAADVLRLMCSDLVVFS